jgi:hypothetical protein
MQRKGLTIDCYLHHGRHRHRSESPEERSRERRDGKKKEKKHKKSKREHRGDSEDRNKDLDDNIPSSRPTLDQLGYSNVNNPFNDINLESKFVWGKKKQRDRKDFGLSASELEQRERDRKREADEELAKLNKRRAERELERKEREEEMERKQREAELAQMGDWHAKEEEVSLRYSYITGTHIIIHVVPSGTSKTPGGNSNQGRTGQTH